MVEESQYFSAAERLGFTLENNRNPEGNSQTIHVSQPARMHLAVTYAAASSKGFFIKPTLFLTYLLMHRKK